MNLRSNTPVGIHFTLKDFDVPRISKIFYSDGLTKGGHTLLGYLPLVVPHFIYHRVPVMRDRPPSNLQLGSSPYLRLLDYRRDDLLMWIII